MAPPVFFEDSVGAGTCPARLPQTDALKGRRYETEKGPTARQKD